MMNCQITLFVYLLIMSQIYNRKRRKTEKKSLSQTDDSEVIQISCDDTFSKLNLQEEDIKLIFCPNYCIESEGKTYGTNQPLIMDIPSYSEDSSICISAVGGGFIFDQEGGLVLIKRLKKELAFVGKEKNGIISLDKETMDIRYFIYKYTGPKTNIKHEAGVELKKEEDPVVALNCKPDRKSFENCVLDKENKQDYSFFQMRCSGDLELMVIEKNDTSHKKHRGNLKCARRIYQGNEECELKCPRSCFGVACK